MTPTLTSEVIPLRPLQKTALDRLHQSVRQGRSRALLHLATGVGKTLLHHHFALSFSKALLLVHRQELLEQALESFRKVAPKEKVSLVHGKRHDLSGRLVIAMIPTLLRRLDHIPKDLFGLVTVDECHHAGSASWLRTIRHFTPQMLLGLSATPERYDGVPLAQLFGPLVFSAGVEKAVASGHLVPPKGYAVHTKVVLGATLSGGDFHEGQLEREIDTWGRNRLVLEHYLALAKGRKTLGYTVSVRHAQNLAAIGRSLGLAAAWVSGDDPDRETKLAAFRKGDITLLFNALLLTEGFDDPSVACILWARPTASRTLYTQAIGRGLRLHPGKNDCTIIDFVDTATHARLVGLWNVMGPHDTPLPDHRRAQAKLEQLSEVATYPLNYQSYLEQINYLIPPPKPRFSKNEYGSREWHYQAATAKQLWRLAQLGYDPTAGWTRAAASYVIAQQPAPLEMQLRLLRHNYDVLGYDWTFEQASSALREIAKRTEASA